MSEPRITCVIVDDEPFAIDGIRMHLKRHPDISVVADARDGASAVNMIDRLHPDLIFLDVQMPEMSGFDVLDALQSSWMPLVVFVSAHQQYAIDGFDVNALHYLLKPVSIEKFDEAVDRVRHELDRERLAEDAEVDAVPSDTRREKPLERLIIRKRDRYRVVKVSDVDWFQGAGNYVRIHCGSERLLHRVTLNELEQSLDPATFVRVHRSTIVNVSRIIELIPVAHGDAELVLENGSVVRLSRSYRQALLDRTG